MKLVNLYWGNIISSGQCVEGTFWNIFQFQQRTVGKNAGRCTKQPTYAFLKQEIGG